jgi:hypothetical protein
MILLLTGTLFTNDCINCERNDINVRRKDYYDNIKRFLDETDLELVFCENSNADLGEIKEFLNNDRVEILQFDGNDYPREFGKGYGEVSIINYALENSKKLSTIDYLLKVTGRYYFNYNKIKEDLKNFDYVLYSKETNFEYYYVCTGFFKVPKYFWINRISDKDISDKRGHYLENIFAYELSYERKTFIMIDISLEGISGTNNKPMEDGLHK